MDAYLGDYVVHKSSKMGTFKEKGAYLAGCEDKLMSMCVARGYTETRALGHRFPVFTSWASARIA